MLINIGSGGNGLDTVSGYMLQNGSPCLGVGHKMTNDGGMDYWGNPLPSTSPDVGVHQKTQ
jgi:hypothetical protein